MGVLGCLYMRTDHKPRRLGHLVSLCLCAFARYVLGNPDYCINIGGEIRLKIIRF
ncbi:hypothetical protein Hanom_Chr16g01498611 [Helianthus anomalus]